MKKVQGILVGLALVSALSLTALATTVTNTPDTQNIPVMGTYQTDDQVRKVYSVDVSWGNMEFTYNNSKGVWDPDTLQYISDAQGKWKWDQSIGQNGLAGNQIQIVNRSNVDIMYEILCHVDPSYSDSSQPIGFDFYEEGHQLRPPFDEVHGVAGILGTVDGSGTHQLQPQTFSVEPKGAMTRTNTQVQLGQISIRLSEST